MICSCVKESTTGVGDLAISLASSSTLAMVIVGKPGVRCMDRPDGKHNSLPSERNHRINPGGTPRREPSGSQCDREEQGPDAYVGSKISCCESKQKRPDGPGCPERCGHSR